MVELDKMSAEKVQIYLDWDVETQQVTRWLLVTLRYSRALTSGLKDELQTLFQHVVGRPPGMIQHQEKKHTTWLVGPLSECEEMSASLLLEDNTFEVSKLSPRAQSL